MNPFVNPRKRSVSLPDGCKDLMDVLKPREGGIQAEMLPIIHLVLFMAQKEHATELVIGGASATGPALIKYKVAGAWHDMDHYSLQTRSEVIPEIARMAKIPVGQFPMDAVMDVPFFDTQLRWIAAMPSADGESLLVRVQEGDETAA